MRVEDRGVGILHSLKAVVGIRSAIEAVEAAFEDGVTSSGEATRGRGLFFCLGLTDKAGSILMETMGASASGWLGEIKSVSSSRGRDSGTSVTMCFPLLP